MPELPIVKDDGIADPTLVLEGATLSRCWFCGGDTMQPVVFEDGQTGAKCPCGASDVAPARASAKGSTKRGRVPEDAAPAAPKKVRNPKPRGRRGAGL